MSRGADENTEQRLQNMARYASTNNDVVDMDVHWEMNYHEAAIYLEVIPYPYIYIFFFEKWFTLIILITSFFSFLTENCQ